MSKITPIHTPVAPIPTAIKDIKTSSNQGIILVNQKSMQQIFLKSGKLAKSNEFQVHYWAVNYRYRAEDNSYLDICVPTVYFNYKQEVTSASIAFDLKDVKKYSEKLEPVHNMMVHKLNEYSLHKKLEEVLNIKLESSPSNFNSIHRHPGSSARQTFSATDLAKTVNEPGVVYPLASANATPNFAGIMAITSNTCKIAHYEYRIASGTLGTDITYTKGRCAAIISSTDSKPSIVESLMGIVPVESSYTRLDACKHGTVIDKLADISYDLYVNHKFEAFTDSVVVEHLEEKTYAYPTYNAYKQHDTFYLNNSLKPCHHTFTTRKTLNKKTLYSLNEIYKNLSYQSTGKRAYIWISTIPSAVTKILELQTILGFTSACPKGRAVFTIKTPVELADMTYTELYAELRAITEHLYPEISKLPLSTTASREDLLLAVVKHSNKVKTLKTDTSKQPKTEEVVISKKKTEEELIRESIDETYGIDEYDSYYY